MEGSRHSRTAHGVALHRAVHQVLEGGHIFRDPFARAILGPDADAQIAAKSEPQQKPMRLFMAVRSRFAEDSLAAAYGRGVRQAVVLGAGLDTFALRNPHTDLKVFEVDHPATQSWKRECLAQAKLPLPASLVFAPVNFEQQGLGDGLATAGFDPGQPTFFIWLGVVPYLTAEAIGKTLNFVAAIPKAEIVFDYSEPLENYPPERRARAEALAARVAAIGEPWLSYFDPVALAAMLRAKGFDEIEDLGPALIAQRFFDAQPSEDREKAGAHVLRARRS